jgi:hypothetical protein
VERDAFEAGSLLEESVDGADRRVAWPSTSPPPTSTLRQPATFSRTPFWQLTLFPVRLRHVAYSSQQPRWGVLYLRAAGILARRRRVARDGIRRSQTARAKLSVRQ